MLPGCAGAFQHGAACFLRGSSLILRYSLLTFTGTALHVYLIVPSACTPASLVRSAFGLDLRQAGDDFAFSVE